MGNWEIVYDWKLDGTVGQNVLHYRQVDAAVPDFQKVCDVIALDMVSAYTDILVPSQTFEGITVREDIVGSVGSTFNPTAGAVPGTASNDQYARVIALLVRKNALGSVRPVKGRVYQPGMTSELLDGAGEWTSGARVAAKNFWEDMIDIVTIGGGTFKMQIKARNPSAPNTNPYNDVNTFGGQPVPATQRRRRIGVGV